MATLNKIVPCLWFDSEAEDAAKHYLSVFGNGSIKHISRYGKEGFEHHGRPEGSVMVVEFELGGQHFTALNGGPMFKFSEAVSFQVLCESQAEIDHFWNRLGEGGQESMCGWLKDRFGFSWQIVPSRMAAMMSDPDAKKVQRAFGAMMQMRKLDIATLERAFEGG